MVIVPPSGPVVFRCSWCQASKPEAGSRCPNAACTKPARHVRDARSAVLTEQGWRQAGYVWTDRGWRRP